MARPLGSTQRKVLECLADRGPWPGNGWTWSTDSETRRICKSLERRGLVELATRGNIIRYAIAEDGLIELFSPLSDSEILRRASRLGGREKWAMYQAEAKRRNLL